MFRLAVFLLLPALCITQNMTFTNCGFRSEIVSTTLVPSLMEQGKYVFYYGHTYRITIVFKPLENFNTHTLKTMLSVKFSGQSQEVPFGVSTDNPCSSGALRCPLHTGQQVTYQASQTMPSESAIPVQMSHLTFVERWRLNDPATGNDVLCILTEAVFKRAP